MRALLEIQIISWNCFYWHQTKERLLTGEDDQDNFKSQARRRLPSARQASDYRRDEDLGGNVELQREGDEDPEAVEQLHNLVHPVRDEEETGSEPEPQFMLLVSNS